MNADLVYIVGGPTSDDRDDLRHSLRSIHQHLNVPIRDVWVIGDVPDWFTGVKMPLDPKPTKFANQRASIDAYVNHPGAADTFILMNDDMYLLEPIEVIEPFCNIALSDTWGNDHHGNHGPDCWTCAVKDTAAWTQQWAGEPVRLYECHTPLHFTTRLLAKAMADYPSDRRFTVGELFPIAGHGDTPSRHAGNAKVKAHDNLEHKLNLDMPWISGNPDSWDGALGAWVRAQWPHPSPWEQA